MKKIEKFEDLPKYGVDVLVSGIDKNQYGLRKFHVAQMDDLEDGVEFNRTGNFFWITEDGRKISTVTHWCELPKIN